MVIWTISWGGIQTTEGKLHGIGNTQKITTRC